MSLHAAMKGRPAAPAAPRPAALSRDRRRKIDPSEGVATLLSFRSYVVRVFQGGEADN
jgi:hypothetical protein